MSDILVDEETLEALNYERSKMWSNFLKRCEENDDGEEIDLNQIEDLYKDEEEESFCAIEEAEEDNVADDINNTTACMTKTELTLMLCSGDNKEVLNQTLPIVEEHVRKWKAAGLDRILNTFDAQKIEQHVGDWLRRHNSAYGEKTLRPDASVNMAHKRYKAGDQPYTSNVSSECESETESMHSVDTARYIRDSRKRTVSTATKCSSSPMTTIKMYRNLPRKRDELRAKYGCDEYNEEQEHRHHMQELLHRRSQRAHRHKREREHIYHTSPRHYPYSAAASFHGQRRRKQLRKRRDSSPLCPSSSSSEDERNHNRCDCSACMGCAFSKTTFPCCSYHSYRSHSHSLYRHQRLELGSRSSHSVYRHSVRQSRRQHAYGNERRPRLLENECSCCNNEQLCSKVVRIVNSSTEEWLVENKSSPDMVQLNTPKHGSPAMTSRSRPIKPTLMPKMHTKIRPSYIDNEAEEDTEEGEEELQPLPESEPKKTKALVGFSNTDEISQTPVPKADVAKSTSVPTPQLDIKNKILPSKSSLSEISKESVKTDSSVDKAAFAKPNISKSSSQKKPARKSVGRQKVTSAETNARSFEENNTIAEKVTDKSNNKSKLIRSDQISDESNDSDDDLKRAIALSKKSYLSERNKLRQTSEIKAVASGSQRLPEQTSFNNQSVACNSTAISNDTACGRALYRKPRKNPTIKRVAAAASTSQAVINLDSSDSTLTLSNRRNQLDGDADCTVVTSTTDCDAATPIVKTAAADVSQRPNIKLTTKGVLLYAPADRTQSFGSNSGSGSGNFTLTEHSLSPIIGKRRARKFFKYHMGNCSFDSRYSVYYRPTAKLAAMLSADARSVDQQSSSSSSSDEDIFDRVQRYGEVYTVLEKSNKDD